MPVYGFEVTPVAILNLTPKEDQLQRLQSTQREKGEKKPYTLPLPLRSLRPLRLNLELLQRRAVALTSRWGSAMLNRN
jgi:hypothetical protein